MQYTQHTLVQQCSTVLHGMHTPYASVPEISELWVQGPILAFIYSVKEMLEEGTDASLPVNVAFVFEGEEENGTPIHICSHMLSPHCCHALVFLL